MEAPVLILVILLLAAGAAAPVIVNHSFRTTANTTTTLVETSTGPPGTTVTSSSQQTTTTAPSSSGGYAWRITAYPVSFDTVLGRADYSEWYPSLCQGTYTVNITILVEPLVGDTLEPHDWTVYLSIRDYKHNTTGILYAGSPQLCGQHLCYVRSVEMPADPEIHVWIEWMRGGWSWSGKIIVEAART